MSALALSPCWYCTCIAWAFWPKAALFQNIEVYGWAIYTWARSCPNQGTSRIWNVSSISLIGLISDTRSQACTGLQNLLKCLEMFLAFVAACIAEYALQSIAILMQNLPGSVNNVVKNCNFFGASHMYTHDCVWSVKIHMGSWAEIFIFSDTSMIGREMWEPCHHGHAL